MAPIESPASDDEEIWNLLADSAVEPVGSDREAHASETLITAAHSTPALSSVAAPEGRGCEGGHCASLGGGNAGGCARGTLAPVPEAAAADATVWVPPSRRPRGHIPVDIWEDAALNAAIAAALPASHDFEVHRTVWRLRRSGARHLGLQMPEGLQPWATALADIFRQSVPSIESVTIFGDAMFGACCIDDLGARALGVDFLVHYGHSCIVPTDQTTVTTLYVHVQIEVDVDHLVETVRHNFGPDKRLAFMGSVQFSAGVLEAVEVLNREDAEDGLVRKVPQVKPLGMGETLGCTSPQVQDVDVVVFVCDGRFHLESAMIQNPHVKGGFFRYDPFALTLTRESFAYGEMHSSRQKAIESARQASCVGLILGTLGRQGSSGVLEEVERLLEHRGTDHLTLLLSEITPERLAQMEGIDAWVQVACPRLSLDWGDAFGKPLLTPYEAHVAFGTQSYKDVYPMDYYSNRGGPWSNYGAHKGHGGSLGQKFRHLRQRRGAVEYEDEGA